jgi:predicted nuclease of predicted toxin-antitoxin system
MKLLFDQNVSPRLARRLADIYPDSLHVREVGLRDADDAEIWEYAKLHGFSIVSKDWDSNSAVSSTGIPQNSSGCASATAPSV